MLTLSRWSRNPSSEPVVLDANGVDTNLHAATAAVSRETSGIGVEETGGAHYGLDQGEIIDQKGIRRFGQPRADRCADISLETARCGQGAPSLIAARSKY